MCGVVAIYAYHSRAPDVDREELRLIRDHMAARGPDGRGEWFQGGRVALGHRRLAVIDLSEAAAQPMVHPDGSCVVSFNGEIYNFRELRRRLEARGCVFRSQSDTEVLLELYQRDGENMVPQLRGMFAFALWDTRRRALFVARDPHGIKPLYIADDGRTARVASQVKALLAGGSVSRQVDPAGVAGFFVFGSVPEPYTSYREVRALEAGCFAWIDERGVGVPTRYFKVARVFREAEEAAPRARHEIGALAREALVDSVRHHLVADVPVGAFLSAGVDSAALVGLMRNVGHEDLSTVTLTFAEFQGTADDEGRGAERVARAWNTRHTTLQVSETDFREHAAEALESMDQPSIDGLNTWFVCRAAKMAGLKVAVSGVGGDELFGGYPSFAAVPRWVRLMRAPALVPGLASFVERASDVWAAHARFPVSPKIGGMARYGGTYPGAYLLKRGLFLPRELPALVGRDMAVAGLERLQPLELLATRLRPSPRTAFGRVATLEASFYLRNQLLRDSDWASMAHSLELRTPLVDAELLRRMAPLMLAVGHGRGKALLGAASVPPVDEETVRRRKTGFSLPIERWLRTFDDDWRGIPLLSSDGCHWARRFAYTVQVRAGNLART